MFSGLRQLNKIIFASLLFFNLHAFAITFESSHMEDILPHVDENAWIVFDVDNTLIESSLMLGSAQWRDHIRKKAELAGFDEDQREEVLDKFWYFVQHFVPVNLVDQETSNIVNALQEKGHIVLALTAREPHETSYTEKQLSSVGLVLSNKALPDVIKIPLAYPCLSKSGIIYCGENKKGAALQAFFATVQQKPKKVIFVDDKWAQVNEVETSLTQAGIDCRAMRFSGADARVESFNPSVADLQWNNLPFILTDEEAIQKIN